MEEVRGKKLFYFILEKLEIEDVFKLYKSNNKLKKLRLINLIRKRYKIFLNFYDFLAGNRTNMEKEKVMKVFAVSF